MRIDEILAADGPVFSFEFSHSLDVVQGLGARLCLAGHGRTFADVQAHIRGNRELVAERLTLVRGALAEGPTTAYEVIPHVFGDALGQQNAHWLISEVLAYLTHLEAQAEVQRLPGERERWGLMDA